MVDINLIGDDKTGEDASNWRGCLAGLNDGSQLGGFYTNPDLFDEAAAVPMTVPAGSLVFFDPHSVHGSYPNSAGNRRHSVRC